MHQAFFEYLLRLGDDRLVLGHRLSEWCGHGPILEEDIAMTNIALDLIGQANLLLQRAGEVEGAGRDADALAYLRHPEAYRNALIVELPRGDFAFTMVRQFLFGVHSGHVWQALQTSTDTALAGIAAKAFKESRYNSRHAGEWMLRLGDGTEESNRRAQDALDELWAYTGELFESDAIERGLIADGRGVSSAVIAERWHSDVSEVLARAGLKLRAKVEQQTGGRSGKHTAHLAAMLEEMQVLQRAHPGAKW